MQPAPAPHEPPTLRYLSYSGHETSPSASSDGRLIAYANTRRGRSQIWLKQFPGGNEVALTEGDDVIGAFPSDRSDDAFRVRILPR